MNRYAALCCYYGRWPEHFPFWLKSCSYNREVTFLLVTDIPTEEYEVPDNVRVVQISFAEVRERVCACFPEVKISLDRPYKLCDFKVAYGYVFEDLFRGYAYWGIFDIDTIWGNVVKFLPENEDCRFKKLLPCGHLSFVRNDEEGRFSFMESKLYEDLTPWDKVFASPESYFFDEEGGWEPIYVRDEGKRVCYDGRVTFDNVLPPWRFDHFWSINFPKKSRCLIYSFEEGTLCRHYLLGCRTCRVEEISYLHISRRRVRVCCDDTHRFIVYPSRIAPWCKLTVWSVFWLGRPRYVANLLRRMARLLGRAKRKLKGEN